MPTISPRPPFQLPATLTEQVPCLLLAYRYAPPVARTYHVPGPDAANKLLRALAADPDTRSISICLGRVAGGLGRARVVWDREGDR